MAAAHSANQPSAVFLSRGLADSSAVFENAMHDFPQRGGYRRTGNGLAAWIEGEQNGKTRRVDLRLRASHACSIRELD